MFKIEMVETELNGKIKETLYVFITKGEQEEGNQLFSYLITHSEVQ